jgi:hypothetical protein
MVINYILAIDYPLASLKASWSKDGVFSNIDEPFVALLAISGLVGDQGLA